MVKQIGFTRVGDLLFVDKPYGLVTIPARGRVSVQALVAKIPEWADFCPMHRIDEYTSGLLALAAAKTRSLIQRDWHAKTLKQYLAVIQTPKWITTTSGEPIEGKSARTNFKVVQARSNFALVLCELDGSGRRHQIRYHLSRLGCPIVGDARYGSKIGSSRKGQMLHAHKLSIQLGLGTPPISVISEIPSDFRELGFDYTVGIPTRFKYMEV